jgi:glutaredoxin
MKWLTEETMRSFHWVAAALAGTLACGLDAAAQSTVYKWTDSQGKVHFSDTPPADQAKGVTQKRIGSGDVDTSQLPYATQLAARKNPVTLYTAPHCGDPCTNARSLLGARGVPYSERNAQASPADAEEVKRRIGALQVPVLVIGPDHLKGYEEGAWQAALDGAGYPRTRLPGTVAPRPVVVPPPPPPPQPEPPADATAAPAAETEPGK